VYCHLYLTLLLKQGCIALFIAPRHAPGNRSSHFIEAHVSTLPLPYKGRPVQTLPSCLVDTAPRAGYLILQAISSCKLSHLTHPGVPSALRTESMCDSSSLLIS
jgi:hypothetical protein